MAFEFYNGGRLLRTGSAAISANGEVRFAGEDLAAIGVEGSAAILVDREARRIGIRPPAAGEYALKVHRRRGGRFGAVVIHGALTAVGVDPMRVSGRHATTIVDGVLALDLSGAVTSQTRGNGAVDDAPRLKAVAG